VSVFVNSYGVKAFGDATAYTTAKNTIAAALLLAICGMAGARADHQQPAARPPSSNNRCRAAKDTSRAVLATFARWARVIGRTRENGARASTGITARLRAAAGRPPPR
jgi:hypothetical protein